MNHIAIYINMALYSIVVHLTVTLSIRGISTPLNNFFFDFDRKIMEKSNENSCLFSRIKKFKNQSFFY